jgi:hypothetical protein
MLSAVRLVCVAALLAFAAGCGDGVIVVAPGADREPETPQRAAVGTLAPSVARDSGAASDASEAPVAEPANAPEAQRESAPETTLAAFPEASRQALLAPGDAGAQRSVIANATEHTRQVGSALIRFRAVLEERTGRDRFEYHFAVSVQNTGGTLLRGAVMVSSSHAATRVVDSCATFGTTPPGTTRDADGPFVIAQTRGAAFDPAVLSFAIDATPDSAVCQDPGRVTLRRLNRSEYDNTVRDLLGTAQQPALDFPADDFGYGFDTIGAVLATSPLLFEKAEGAARALVEEFLRVAPAPASQRIQAETGTAECGAVNANAWLLWSECDVAVQANVPLAAEYEIRVRAWASQAGPEIARMQIRAGLQVVGAEIEVPATASNPAVYTLRTTIPAGMQTLRAEFTNDFYEEPADRNLWVDWIELYGPLNVAPPSAQANALRALCDPGVAGRIPCTRTRVAAFARKAWRRPPTTAEIDALVALADDAFVAGADESASLGVALRAVLTSPHFLFRIERDPHPRSAEVHPLGDHELAARLSYFLWSSTPDATLDALADAGTLSAPATLAAQVQRMIRDPKARGFIDSYAGQWLRTRALEDVNPDYALFPAWDAALEDAMREETHLFLQEFLTTQTDFLGFFDARFTYLNDRLAQHYGLPAPGSTTPVRVALPASGERGGIFTHASVLTVSSQPRRTSPVKRGKWALDQILCIDIPPPPAGVEGMLDTPGQTGTLRERLAAHRANPECASCHDYLDPIGLGLEHFDAIGAWRTVDEGQAIDASGQFPDGRSFDGAAEMAALVKADPNTPRCLAERLLIYALGRGLEDADEAHLDAISAAFQSNGRTLESLIVAIVQSEPFRMRRGEHAGEATP